MNTTHGENYLLLFCKIDPTGFFEREADHMGVEYVPERLIDACGFIPHWVVEYAMDGDKSGVKGHLEKTYGFGPLRELTGGRINEANVYQYPEDPPLHPLISMNLGDEGLLLMYQYGIVAIPTPDGYFITRMD